MMLSTIFVVLRCVTTVVYASGGFVNDINVIDMKLRNHLLAATSTLSVPVVDRSRPINVTLGIEMKKVIQGNQNNKPC